MFSWVGGMGDMHGGAGGVPGAPESIIACALGGVTSNPPRGRATGRHIYPLPPGCSHHQHAHHMLPNIKICNAHQEGVAYTLNHPLSLRAP
jgi:hypothetical protein